MSAATVGHEKFPRREGRESIWPLRPFQLAHREPAYVQPSGFCEVPPRDGHPVVTIVAASSRPTKFPRSLTSG